MFEKLVRNRLHDFNVNGFSDWKKSYIVNRAPNDANDINTHINALDGKRSTLLSGGRISQDVSDMLLETSDVCILHSEFTSTTKCP